MPNQAYVPRFWRHMSQMEEDDQQAFSIYELITITSADRPYAFRSLEQAKSETAAWQAKNPGLEAMRNASPMVLLAFLRNYKGWRGASDRGIEATISN